MNDIFLAVIKNCKNNYYHWSGWIRCLLIDKTNMLNIYQYFCKYFRIKDKNSNIWILNCCAYFEIFSDLPRMKFDISVYVT